MASTLPLKTLEDAIQVRIDTIADVTSHVVYDIDLEIVKERRDIPSLHQDKAFVLIGATVAAESIATPSGEYLGTFSISLRVVVPRKQDIDSTLHGTNGLRDLVESVKDKVVSSFVGLTPSVDLLEPLQWRGDTAADVFDEWLFADILLEARYAEVGFVNAA